MTSTRGAWPASGGPREPEPRPSPERDARGVPFGAGFGQHGGMRPSPRVGRQRVLSLLAAIVVTACGAPSPAGSPASSAATPGAATASAAPSPATPATASPSGAAAGSASPGPASTLPP